MYPTFYGNAEIQHTLRQMLRHNRVPQSFLLYGDPGLGKKTLALRLAATLLCSDPGDRPCGSCKSCRMLEKQAHPDATIVPHSGKLGGFSVETVRGICRDLATPPNEGDHKCYFFFDCDQMDARSQNLLLKAVEEPPAYAYFFFTATAQTALLPTIRSRVTPMALMPVSPADCRSALVARGYDEDDCTAAIAAFHGNIGACLDFLEKDAIRETVALTKSAIHSIIKKDEYALLQAAAAAATDREQARLFLTLLGRCIRDAAARRHNPAGTLVGCDALGASRLAGCQTAAALWAMHQAIDRTYAALQANVNLSLALAALCASCMDAR